MADARQFLNNYNAHQARERAMSGQPNAVDDIRHKVVEEGWYGKQTTGNTQWGAAPDPDAPQAHAVVDSGHNPYSLDGVGAQGDADANPEGVKEAAQDFYGNPNPDYEGTVWQNEGQAEIRAGEIQEPEISPPTQDDLEPEH